MPSDGRSDSIVLMPRAIMFKKQPLGLTYSDTYLCIEGKRVVPLHNDQIAF